MGQIASLINRQKTSTLIQLLKQKNGQTHHSWRSFFEWRDRNLRRQKCRLARTLRCLVNRPGSCASQCAQVARCQHHAETHSQHGRHLPACRRWQLDIECECAEQSRSTLRDGENHARLRAGAGPFVGAFWSCSRLTAWWVRHWFAACRSAHQRLAGHGRKNCGRTWLHGGKFGQRTDSLKRRAHCHGHGHCDGHRKLFDGRCFGRGRNCFRQCSTRTRNS